MKRENDRPMKRKRENAPSAEKQREYTWRQRRESQRAALRVSAERK